LYFLFCVTDQPPGRQRPDIALHDAPWAQSAADWQGNAHFPYCTLQRPMMHDASS
jgi:hypothetical protein